MGFVAVEDRAFNLIIISWTIWWIQFLPQPKIYSYAARDAPSCGGSSTISINCTSSPSSPQPLMKSPNGTFLMSFRSYNSTSNSSTNSYYLAISFAASPNSHPVWTANRNSPVSSTAKLTLDSSGNLILYDPSSGTSSSSPLWSSNTSNTGVSEAQLLETGNLVLITSTSSNTIWQSFDHPTDTLLPGQNFSSKLFSPSGSADLSAGLFVLSFTSDGSLLQITNTSSYAYYNVSEVSSPGYFSFDQLGEFSNLKSGPVTSDQGFSSTLRKLTLDMDGNLRMYTWDESSSEWNIVWLARTHICDTLPNICGDYGICLYDPQPACVCPPGMSPVSSDEISSGCSGNTVYKTSSECDIANPYYLTLDNIDFPNNDFDDFTRVSEDTCKKRCTEHCSCLAAVYWRDGSGHCWLKRILQNGRAYTDGKFRVFLRYSASLNISSVNISSLASNNATYWSYTGLWQAYNITATANTNSSITITPAPIPNSNTLLTLKRVIIALGVAFATLLIGYTMIIAMVVRKYRERIRYTKLQMGLEAVSGSPVVFTYQELELTTSNFAQKLGEGAFGSVYKGKLPRGNVVAVKKLEGLSQHHGEKQFRAEIATIGRIHHINLLPLLGFCAEDNHKLLVYDYMENGSLDRVLFSDTESDSKLVLNWQIRYQICLGVARGISYLHHECSECIVHCDIKPQNILLDHKYSAKVSDFGVAYLYSRDHTINMTTVRGTRGYMAPEWLSNLPVTTKADVYSYGMLVMEIVSGKRNFKPITDSVNEDEEDDDDRSWCFPVWAYGKRPEEVLDSKLLHSSGELHDGVDLSQVDAVMKVAFLCIQRDHRARPSMAMVVQMLEGAMPIPELREPPSFLPGTRIHYMYNLSPGTTTTNPTTNVSVISTGTQSDSIFSAR